MMQSEPMLQPSWPIHSYFDSTFGQDGLEMDFFTGKEDRGFHSPITMETFDDICRWLNDDNDNDDQHMKEIPIDSYEWSPSISMNSTDACAYISNETQSSMVDDVMEIDSQTGIQNLLIAHADAMGLNQTELANVIQKCVCQKASPNGPILERLALNLFQSAENQEQEYLKQESMRNFKTAFRAFYEIFPYIRFAHFTANSAILEAIPAHVNSVHIVDFDMCEGSQWPPVIEAIARMKKSLIITSIKLDHQDSQLDEARWHLCNFARSVDLDLKVQEMDIAQMLNGIKGREFIAFNCMVNLPHMKRTRKAIQVLDFIKLAKGFLAKNKGIITFGDGEDLDRTKNSSSYTSFFEGNMAHYKALYESMEWGFPRDLTEGRIAMETLFVSPFINSKSWFQKWEEGRENINFRKDLQLKEQTMNKESMKEAKELVKEGETPYGIRIEGQNGNEIVLEWKGIPLVRVSSWM